MKTAAQIHPILVKYKPRKDWEDLLVSIYNHNRCNLNSFTLTQNFPKSTDEQPPSRWKCLLDAQMQTNENTLSFESCTEKLELQYTYMHELYTQMLLNKWKTNNAKMKITIFFSSPYFIFSWSYNKSETC